MRIVRFADRTGEICMLSEAIVEGFDYVRYLKRIQTSNTLNGQFFYGDHNGRIFLIVLSIFSFNLSA